MLRALVLVLVLANLLYLVWVKSLLAPYGFAPANQAEPERLNQQIRPEAIQLLEPGSALPPASAVSGAASAPVAAGSAADSPKAAASSPTPAASAPAAPASAPTLPPASAPVVVPALVPVAAHSAAPVATPVAPVPRQCLQAGLFTERQASAMRGRLQAGLPAGSWSFVTVKEPVHWIVYLGNLPNKEALKKKRAQLERAGISVDTPASPQLNSGLSLGSYHTQAQAKAALAKLAKRGINSAEVVQDKPELPNRWIRLPAVDKALQVKAKTLILHLSGQALKPCA
jgi:cell division protein FtsN